VRYDCLKLTKIDESILAGHLKWRPTFEPKMVMKETENCLLHNLESQLWAIGCVEIYLGGLLVHITNFSYLYFDNS
jgi:hypothetical protein